MKQPVGQSDDRSEQKLFNGLRLLSSAEAAADHARRRTPNPGFRSNGQTTEKLESERSLSNDRTPPTSLVQFTSSQVQKALEQLQAQPLRPQGQSINCRLGLIASKTNWLKAIYENQLVEASWATALLSDKLILDRVLRSLLGSDWSNASGLRTLGLVEFLIKHQLIDSRGRWRASRSSQDLGERLDEALAKEFPNGFVVRPAVGVSKAETTLGLFATSDDFIQDILKASTDLYRPEHLKRPRRSLALDHIASGELYVLQEQPRPANWTAANQKARWREVRVHTYEGQVIAGTVVRPWTSSDRPDDREVAAAESFVRQFLLQLPSRVLARQAWSVDVWVRVDHDEPSGGRDSSGRSLVGAAEVRLFEVITNRGRPGAWSQYLEQPRVLAAYTRHFEQHANVQFSGLGVSLFRLSLGNYFGYWAHRIDRSPPGLSRWLAYLPPWP